jgi:hypothetical protein
MSRFKSAGTTEHGYFEERLSAYLDGELTPHEHEAVEHHLETCSACQWDLETLGQTIQWTRELPMLTVPRVFTIPVPAEPERASWRRWNLLPVLQGATALIAVLLVFAVAGDLMLGRVGMVLAPDTAPQQELAPSSTDVFLEVTVEVEKAVEEPAAEPAPEMMVAETVVVESEVVVTPTEAPMALRMSPTAPLVSGEALAPVAPGTEGAWKNGEEEVREEEAAPPEASMDELEADAEAVPVEEGAVAGGGEPTLSLPAPSPPISDTARTAVAVATQLALAPEMGRDEAATGPSRGLGVNWLRVVEVSLGGVLVLMVAATVFFTIERRRAR